MNMKSTADRRYLIPRVVSHMLGDILAVIIAWVAAFYVRFYLMPQAQSNQEVLFSCLGVVAVVLTIYFQSRNKLYDINLGMTWRKQVGLIFKTTCEVFISFTTLYYFFFHDKISRMNLILASAFLFIMLLITRSIVGSIFTRAFAKGKYVQKVLLVGHGERLAEFVKACKPVAGLVMTGQYLQDGQDFGVPSIQADSLRQAVEASGADVVIMAFPFCEKEQEDKLVAEGLDLLETKVYLLPHIPASYAGTVISDFHFVPTLELNAAEMSLLERMEKRLFDVVSCSIAVILLSPLYLVLALLVRVSSKGPIFFRQKRITRDGRVFTMLKFRSMRVDMPEQGGAHWTEENDPRVTKIGRFMRKTSLDELPQFFNVIGGSMSLIGPRPERPELVAKFITEIPGYNMRHLMKAGISGWAQVNGLRGNTSLTKRIDFDLYYIRNWSIWFDFKIVFMTFFKGFVNKNAY